MKNESKKYLWAFMLAVLATSCQSNRADTSSAILEHQRKIDELENTLTRIDIIMSDTASGLNEITSRSAGMEDEIDAIIGEFGEYQQRVEQLLREYNAIRSGTDTRKESNANAWNNLWRADID